MAKRKRKGGPFIEREPGISPDARGAIEAARRGNCRMAAKHLYDAAPHIQRHGAATERDRDSFRLASIIVAQHCSAEGRRGRGRDYSGFSGRGASRRRKRRR